MKKQIKQVLLFVGIMLTHFSVKSQVLCPPGGGIYAGCGSGPAHVSAAVDMESNNKGLLIPRMTEVQKLAITTPATGLLVFQTDATSGFHYYDGTAWQLVGGADSDWVTSGTDLYSGVTGNIGIGTTTPGFKIDIMSTSGPRTRVFSQDNFYAGYLSKNNTREFFAGVQGTFETPNTTSGYHIYDNTAGAQRMVIDENGNMGINNSNPTARLDVAGTLKLADGTEGAGKVLTSDANGNASWQTGAVNTDNQDLSLSGNSLSLTNDATPVDLSGYMDNTDAQTLSLATNTLSIAGGNSVSLATYLDNTDAQDLSLSGNSLSLTNDATPVDLSAYMDNTDAQTLSLATNTLSIAGGNSVSLATYLDNTDAQDLSLSGNSLSLTNDATPVDLSAYMDNTDAQTLTLSGTNLSIANGNTVSLAALGGGWGLSGNAGTTASNFIGTTDAQDLNIRTNNTLNLRIKQNGAIETFGSGVSVAVGQQAGSANLSGGDVMLGYRAGTNLVNGAASVLIGYNAGYNCTSGQYNVFIGREAAYSGVSSDWNTYIGFQSGYYSTTGGFNAALGAETLKNNTTGNFNTAIGTQALAQNTTGTQNVALGRGASNGNTVGSNNTFIGYYTSPSANNLTNATAIGHTAVVNASNKVRVGNTSITAAEVQVAWTVTSDKNAKKDISYDALGLDFISKLQPATYKYITHDESAPRYTGLLAQDVDAVLTEMGIESSIVAKPNEDGTGSWGIRYAELTMPLINAVKELSEENKVLKAKLEELDQLKADFSEIKAMLETKASK